MEKLVLNKIALKSFWLLSASAVLAGCAVEGLEPVYGIDSNTTVTGFFSQKDNARIEGTGRVRFDSLVPTVSSRSLSLKASLDQTIANSSVAVIMYSPDLTVPEDKGIVVKFSRAGATVNATVSFNNTTNTVASSRLVYYIPASLDLIIEVHNVQSKARLLVWRRDMIGYTPLTADIDTQRTTDFTSYSLPVTNGGGGIAGLALTNAAVLAATISSQKLPD